MVVVVAVETCVCWWRSDSRCAPSCRWGCVVFFIVSRENCAIARMLCNVLAFAVRVRRVLYLLQFGPQCPDLRDQTGLRLFAELGDGPLLIPHQFHQLLVLLPNLVRRARVYIREKIER